MRLNKKELIKWKVISRMNDSYLIFDNGVIRLWKSAKDVDDNNLPIFTIEIFTIEKLGIDENWYMEYEF